ncbi:MAG: nucleotide sugar dehydrogenase [Kiritimatiellota bacterium]|nr:nucleotide sugar dehydrogenase [Kiritimatiellota bacterium]
MPLADLKQQIAGRSARIGVIGLGYVGLPVAALFAQKGFDVVGIDIKAERVEKITQGISPIEGKEPGLAELISEVVNSGKLKTAIDYSCLKDRDVVLIDVETPVNDEHIPEYHALKEALKSLAGVMKPGVLVVVESTIMPGTMQKIALPLLETLSGRSCGDGFYLGNCPERVMPGKLISNLRLMSRVVGGDSLATAEVMKLLYQQVVEAEVDEADWITAELVKTVENTYRDVQIAFANEVALICEAMGADVWRVRELVRKSPGREMLLPGAGVGGHCIPKDPWLLASAVRGLDVDVRLIPAARAVNSEMPRHVLRLLKDSLGGVKGLKILLLGYAYLENSDDMRNSPSDYLLRLLKAEGAEVAVHDPYVEEFNGDLYALADGCNAAVLMTAHSEYMELDFERLKACMARPLLVDGRNLWNKTALKASGFELVRLGDFSE